MGSALKLQIDELQLLTQTDPMARPVRIEFPGAIYHVTSRMIGSWRDRRERLFRDNADYERFLHRLEQSVTEAGIRLYLFCLMSNHFHLVLETPEGNLSRFMHRLTTAYTIYYNLRHRRHGHLLDGRFKAKLVSGDEYLLRLSRYVHQNPVWVAGWKTKPLKRRRMVEPLAPGTVLQVVCRAFGAAPEDFGQRRSNTALRAVGAKCLVRYCGQSQRAAAELLGLGTGAAVSAQLKMLEGRLAKDRSLRGIFASLEEELDAMRSDQAGRNKPKLSD